MKNKIPKPITFNPYKHHYYFINEQIRLWKKEDSLNIKSGLVKLGDNLLDLYFGKLTVNEICTECTTFLADHQIIEKNSYLNWLKPLGYKKIQLSDKSVWIVREGEDLERYIHIHPAKNSIHTTRVRATTLKTVIALKATLKAVPGNYEPTLAEVNDARVNLLGLSPVKKLKKGKGIAKLWQLFTEK